MKVSKPIVLHVPNRFVQELNAYLKANKLEQTFDVNYFYFVAHHLFVNQLTLRNNIDEKLSCYVPINLEKLKDITTYKIGDYINLLVKGEFIKCDNDYAKGKKSKYFILNKEYLGGLQKIEIQSNSKLFQRIVARNRKTNSHNNRMPEFLKQMRDEFLKLNLDYHLAEKWLLSEQDEVKRLIYGVSIELLKDKRFRYFKRNKTNLRLDTNLTNLKSDFRQFLLGDYVSIDLKNSQPFFLNQLLKSIVNSSTLSKGNLCSEIVNINLVKTFGIKRIKKVLLIHQNANKSNLANLKHFENSVNSGTLYDAFYESFEGAITRKHIKEIIFKVLFSKNEVYAGYKRLIPFEKDKKIFESGFPIIYDCVKSLKERDNKILPVALQKIESYLFIDCIAKELTEAGVIPLTIHDSIIIKSVDQTKVIEIMERIFMQHFNVIPTFEIKNLTSNN